MSGSKCCPITPEIITFQLITFLLSFSMFVICQCIVFFFFNLASRLYYISILNLLNCYCRLLKYYWHSIISGTTRTRDLLLLARLTLVRRKVGRSLCIRRCGQLGVQGHVVRYSVTKIILNSSLRSIIILVLNCLSVFLECQNTYFWTNSFVFIVHKTGKISMIWRITPDGQRWVNFTLFNVVKFGWSAVAR